MMEVTFLTGEKAALKAGALTGAAGWTGSVALEGSTGSLGVGSVGSVGSVGCAIEPNLENHCRYGQSSFNCNALSGGHNVFSIPRFRLLRSLRGRKGSIWRKMFFPAIWP